MTQLLRIWHRWSESREHHLDLINRFYDDMWNQFDKTLFAEILEPIT